MANTSSDSGSDSDFEIGLDFDSEIATIRADLRDLVTDNHEVNANIRDNTRNIEESQNAIWMLEGRIEQYGMTPTARQTATRDLEYARIINRRERTYLRWDIEDSESSSARIQQLRRHARKAEEARKRWRHLNAPNTWSSANARATEPAAPTASFNRFAEALRHAEEIELGGSTGQELIRRADVPVPLESRETGEIIGVLMTFRRRPANPETTFSSDAARSSTPPTSRQFDPQSDWVPQQRVVEELSDSESDALDEQRPSVIVPTQHQNSMQHSSPRTQTADRGRGPSPSRVPIPIRTQAQASVPAPTQTARSANLPRPNPGGLASSRWAQAQASVPTPAQTARPANHPRPNPGGLASSRWAH
ncbi:hypothetical protein MMC09_003346 [Bachmanniomyces sp. S44760]|nr:hypothetical protein [Bachmanniomyces sp. S44760]